jgi:hypothetical protein
LEVFWEKVPQIQIKPANTTAKSWIACTLMQIKTADGSVVYEKLKDKKK